MKCFLKVLYMSRAVRQGPSLLAANKDVPVRPLASAPADPPGWRG